MFFMVLREPWAEVEVQGWDKELKPWLLYYECIEQTVNEDSIWIYISTEMIPVVLNIGVLSTEVLYICFDYVHMH